jgi:glycine cleavage system H protein
MKLVKIDDFEVREGLYYHKEHFWAKVEDGSVRVGATDYGQKSLKEVVFVELPSVGDAVKQNEPYGTVESVKAVVDLIAPVGGTIKEVNEKLLDDPEPINQDPYGEGWLIVVSPSNLDAELNNIMTFEAAVEWYREVIKG